MLLSLDARWCGLRRSQLDGRDMPLAGYVAGSEGSPALLLIHGFTGSKQVWSRVARGMRSRYRVVAPDLPGHGDSADAPASACRAEDHAERLVSMLDRMDIRRTHIVGSSFGGFIAARIAALYPSRVASLVLFSPAGVTSPSPSAFDSAIAKGANPFLVDDDTAFKRFYASTMSKPPRVPRPVLTHTSATFRRRRAAIERMYAAFAASAPLAPVLGKIVAPTMLVWGSEDQVIDVSAARLWKQGIASSRLELWDGIGHLPMLEAPRRVVRSMLGFLASQESPATRWTDRTP
ncbi:alpha/beta fold hydrolase [Frateuria sp. GZRR35]|uniref:alpha/beta fold hydrolase n=1 Tax=unclassified Frateuria TaxID=2648894 RepID=UPI003EDBAD74